MADVYILKSLKLNKFYIGSCLDLERRFLDHQQGAYSSFTKSAKDWELFFEIRGLDGTAARKIEKHIKSMKSKKYIENLQKYPEMKLKLLAKFE